MDRLLYCLALGLVKFFQALPLRAVARLGRAGGGLAYWIDARHRRVAIENLTRCFGQERPPIEIRALARENFKRLGENYCCAIKTAGMSWAELQKHLEFDGMEKLDVAGDREENPSADRRGMKPANTSESSPSPPLEEKARGEEAVFSGPTVHLQRQSADASDSSGSASCVIAIGHFGNFEVYSRANQVLPQFQFASTYRALKQPALNKLLFDLRTRSGCLLFERRRESEALR